MQTRKLYATVLRTILLLILMCTPLFFSINANAAAEDYLTYKTNEDGTITITRCSKTYEGAMEIPSTIDGKPVTELENGSFNKCSYLTEVTIPDTVTTIDFYAFMDCTSLEKVTIPDSVTEIGEKAFQSCTALTSIKLPDSVTTLGSNAFNSCTNLTDIKLSNKLTAIASRTFSYCKALETITIPGSVKEIGMYAFDDCINLETVVLNKGVELIGDYCFYELENLTNVTIPESLNYLCTSAFTRTPWFESLADEDGFIIINDMLAGYTGNETELMLPDGITSVAEGTFKNSSMTSITIPEGVTTLCTYSFLRCYSLETIHIPKSLTTIMDDVFRESYGITDVYYAGTIEQFNKIEIGELYNEYFLWADIHCSDGDIHIHNYEVTETVDATSTEEGYILYTCRCGDTKTEILPIIRVNPFTDISEDSYYYDAVFWAVENGITQGTGDGTTFSPSMKCDRAQVVTFLWRAAGSPEPKTTGNPFTDVKETDYFYKPVLWAVENAITSGTGGTNFSPNRTCDRAQVVTFLHRAQKSPEPVSTVNPFTDVKETDYFYKPVLWAVENGITSGTGGTNFSPNMTCDRAQVVTFLSRAFQ